MLKLASIFTDHMVLQREKPIAVWGCSDKDEVTIRLYSESDNINEVISASTKKQKFMTWLSPQKASGPYALEVTDGTDKVVFCDVMIGEVWLAGGQSNMEFELHNCNGGADEVNNVTPGKVRYYYTPKIAWYGTEMEEALSQTSWELSTPTNCGKWSAVGYFFAKKLAQNLGVTVGVIGCNWGGTSASCWTSRQKLEQYPELKGYLEEYDEAVKDMDEAAYIKEYEDYVVYQAEFDKNVGNYYMTNPNPTWEEAISLFGENKYPGPMGPRNFSRPYGLYEVMLKQVMPFSLRGFIFYQGEEDDNRPYTYKTLLTAMIEQWREDWQDDTTSFLLVQLPRFRNEGEDDCKNWPFIREAQMLVAKELKNVGLAVTLDLGEDRNIHPLEKKQVGERLAKVALYQTYGMIPSKEALAPQYKECRIENDKVVISFEYAEDGFDVVGDKVDNFEIAGEDKVYVPAMATVDGSNIILKSEEISKPLYARYYWTNYADVNIYGKNGIALAPFRTSLEDGAKANGSRQGRLKN